MIISQATADMVRVTFTIASNDWYANRAAIDAMQRALATYMEGHSSVKMRCTDWNIRQRSLHETLE